MEKTLVIYHYFEKDKTYRDNLQFFLTTSLCPAVDYVFIVSGGSSVSFPSAPNVSVVYKRNEGFDFGSYEEFLSRFREYEQYAYFIFLNCTVRGPFLPPYCDRPWTRCFTDRIKDDVKLVGATINILRGPYFAEPFRRQYAMREPFAHVQTPVFAMDYECMQFLLGQNFFGRGLASGLEQTIIHYELLLSQLVLRNGWNISCLMPEYELDYRTVTHDVNPTSASGDPLNKASYFGRSLHPYETIMFKTNRGTISDVEMASITNTALLAAGESKSLFENAELDKILARHPSAWTGHKNFANWLVAEVRPEVVVDLGVDFGFSTFCFAFSGARQVFGLDSFEGDEQTGKRNTYEIVLRTAQELGLGNLTLIKGYFADAARSWSKPIDILHIDGQHKYEDVARDFREWQHFVKRDGVILFHDVCVEYFGVRQLFDEIRVPKVIIVNSCGLGVVCREASMIHKVAETFSSLVEPGSVYV